MGEFRVDAERGLRLLVRQGDRHEGDVIQISRSCPRKVSMAEPGYRTVRIEISRYPVPPGQPVVRTQLHHPERCLCPRICVACVVCPYQRVHNPGIVFRLIR